MDDKAEGEDDEEIEEMKSSSMVSGGCVSTRVVASECSEGILVETSVATTSSSVLLSGKSYFDLELEAFVKKSVSFFDMVTASRYTRDTRMGFISQVRRLISPTAHKSDAHKSDVHKSYDQVIAMVLHFTLTTLTNVR